jgi:hypothetical protein
MTAQSQKYSTLSLSLHDLRWDLLKKFEPLSDYGQTLSRLIFIWVRPLGACGIRFRGCPRARHTARLS